VTSPAFLNVIGLLQRLPVWRAAFANRRDAAACPEVAPAETAQPQLISSALSSTSLPRTANDLPAPVAPIRTATLGEPGSDDGMPQAPASRPRRWVYACAAAAAFGFLVLWLDKQPEQPVRALTALPAVTRAPVTVSPAPAPEPALAAVEEDTLEMAAWEEPSEMDADLAADPEPVLPEPEPAEAIAPPLPATRAPALALAPALPEPGPTVAAAPQAAAKAAPAPAPDAKKQPDFRLSGIIYTVARPAAIVNGQTVFVGDWVNGATVVSIDRTQVTLQINGQHKTCVFRKGKD
jgi:hypothetical protein